MQAERGKYIHVYIFSDSALQGDTYKRKKLLNLNLEEQSKPRYLPRSLSKILQKMIDIIPLAKN